MNKHNFSPMPDGWQKEILEGIISGKYSDDWLFTTLEIVSELYESTSPIPALCHAAKALLESKYIDLDEEARRIAVRDLFSLISVLTRLKTALECLNFETGYIDKQIKADFEKGG